MFRNMRRKNQLLSEEKTVRILESCTAGVLAVNGDDGYPYAVPMSYAYKDGSIFMHCAKEGHKIDSIRNNDKVTFTVIERDEVIQETFTTHFRSVIVFGRAVIIDNIGAKHDAFQYLLKKYSPDFIKEGQIEIAKDIDRTCIIEIKIENMTGKAAIEIIDEDE